MKFVEDGFEMSKAMVTALASIRNTKKGSHPACRLWYWDNLRKALYVVGESMVLRCIGDIIAFAEHESAAYPFDIEIIRKEVLPHVSKGTFLRIVTDVADGVVALVVQEETEETPEEILVRKVLNADCCPNPPPTSVFDQAIPEDWSASDHGRSSWAEISPYLHFSHLDSIAKASKVLKATAVRVQPPEDDSPTSPVRIDLALPAESGRWTAMLMPVVLSG